MTDLQYEDDDFSEVYAKFRPTYPPQLFDTIMEYHRQSATKSGSKCGFDTAIDLGCGTGQATRPLTQHFRHVKGIDISSTQIEVARRELPDISFRVGMGEDLSFLPDNSVDLVTVATAIHWMSGNLVYPEVKRVLKPGGTMAVFMYDPPLLTNPDAQMVFHKIWRETLWNYWNGNITHIANYYNDLDFPLNETQRVDDISLTKSVTLDELFGFISSWVSCKAFLKANPDSDFVESSKARLHSILNTEGETSSPMLEMKHNYVLLLGRNNRGETDQN